ncbi:TetR/AcrR family transcriptional regulator [Frateuria defendens]|uniref:TetR/AcrR family transcriptional regulator n=1 Tax=Frateuria defendens TaxID=2219559 RepID=UPI00066FEBA1|nr:TetR/AcrR family transcriptional regulator [Frateuria defendens]
MPYTVEHKRKTRERIVECARELFNRKGFVEVSIDEIMARAGLTRGGFYNHFKAKEDLFFEAIEAYLDFDPGARWDGVPFTACASGKTHAREMVNAYLSRAHLDDLDAHCPMIALPSDVARAGPRVKEAYRHLLERMAGILAAGLAESDPEQERRRGLALAALCVGGMVLARTFEDQGFREEIREAVRSTALEMVG